MVRRVYPGKRGGGGGAGRRAHSSSSFVRPGGPAYRRSTESPSSRAWLIGEDWAGRAYHPEWSRTEACRRTAARLRALRSTCAAQCNGAAGHHEGKVWRRRRRALGWAQGVCRAGRTIGGSTFRRDGWEGPADGNVVSARKTAWQRRSYLGESRAGLDSTGYDTRSTHTTLLRGCVLP